MSLKGFVLFVFLWLPSLPEVATTQQEKSPMDGLVEELLRLESAKHKALIEIDASSYDANVREQLRLVTVSKVNPDSVANLESVLALSQLITLNSRLLQNLISTTPWFAF